MGTLGVGSASGSQLGLSGPTLRASHGAPAMGWSLAVLGPFCFDLQHVLKWFLFPHLWHFLPHAGHSLSGWDMLHLPHVLPGPPLALWPLPFLNLNVLISSMVVAIAIPPLDLCQLKSFTVISCAPWHVGGGLDMLCPLSSFLIWPTFWLQNVLLHEKATLSYIPFSQLQFGTGIFPPDLWYIDLTGQLTHVLLVWCHCTSHWCGSSRR